MSHWAKGRGNSMMIGRDDLIVRTEVPEMFVEIGAIVIKAAGAMIVAASTADQLIPTVKALAARGPMKVITQDGVGAAGAGAAEARASEINRNMLAPNATPRMRNRTKRRMMPMRMPRSAHPQKRIQWAWRAKKSTPPPSMRNFPKDP